MGPTKICLGGQHCIKTRANLGHSQKLLWGYKSFFGGYKTSILMFNSRSDVISTPKRLLGLIFWGYIYPYTPVAICR